MNLTEELHKLAGLHQAGQLTDGEFTAAKGRLLAQGPTAPPATAPGAASQASAPDFQAKTYRSSRWSSGNLFFPDRLRLAADGMHFRKGALFGSDEQHINYRAVASLRIKNGILLADVNVETSGGSQPVFLNGLWKSDAREIQAMVQAVQKMP